MAKNVVIRGIVYPDCPEVDIPINNSNEVAKFIDTSDATIISGSQMLDGVTSYGVDGVKYTGNIETKTAASLTVNGATVTAPAGYYTESASATVATGSATTPSTTITTTPTITVNNSGLITASVSEEQNITPTVVAGYVSSGTAGKVTVSGSETNQLTTKSAQTYIPTTSDQIINAGQYLTGVQTIKGDSNLVGSNIVYGVSIFNVAGTVQMPIISQDPVTKILSIS